MNINKEVEKYINSLKTDKEKEIVINFIEYMLNEYNKLQLKISYSIPMFLIGSKMKEGYIGINTAKEYFSIHFSDEKFIINLKQKFTKCRFGKQCIKIKYDDIESFNTLKENIKDFLIKKNYFN